ncbi:MAG: hypothetical protein HN742_00510 [Lentisphaerae bacterium]|jgi:hypothetical protein|nr:hypothetical protein [Lentisphaerota bacterium]MBT4817317.1 hypothetical protein [Lentisphaerota bacterium]MBT5608826.1 hypothetical protein [Lentisphaerota bacterium]MBT7059986.1 hypothetical protein [Lentisphaerota bacterium]MBT7840312.1 hypothetical protein [Lentisphaerota bacterium]
MVHCCFSSRLLRGLSLSLLLATGARLAGQAAEEVFQADFFSRESTEAWELSRDAWTILDGALRGKSSRASAFAVAGGAPELEAQVLEMDVVPGKRLAPDGWAVTALLLYQDRGSYWQMALVEGPPPEQRRYIEFGEMYRGTWKANSSGQTALERTEATGSDASWEYGQACRLRITLTVTGVTGEAIRPADGAVLQRTTFAFGARSAVRFGRLGLRNLGFEVTTDRARVVASALPAASELGLTIEAGESGRVAMLDDQLPGAREEFTATYVDALRKAGFGVTRLSGEQLSGAGVLSTRRFDWLAIVPCAHVPASALSRIRRFLRGGGRLLALGGRPFSEPCSRVDGRWLSATDIQRLVAGTAPQHMLFDFEAKDALATWTRSSGSPEAPTKARREPTGTGTHALRVDIRGLKAWDTLAVSGLAQPFPGDHRMTCFRAKGHARTPDLAVEWRENDGTRWIATVPLTTEWQQYALLPREFAHWRDSRSPTGRGSGGNSLNPKEAEQLSFGLAFSHTAKIAGDHTYWVDDVGTAPMPFDPALMETGEPLCLSAFSDAYPWESASGKVTLASPKGHPLVPVAFSGELTDAQGEYVIGFPKPHHARLVSLIGARDRYRRSRGSILSALVHHGGPYRGGVWLLSGIRNAELLGSAEFANSVAHSAKQLSRASCLADLSLDRLTYAQGGKASMEVTVGTRARGVAHGRVRVQVVEGDDASGETVFKQELSLAQAGTQLVRGACTWELGESDIGAYTAVTELMDGEKVVDRMTAELEVVPEGLPPGACRQPVQLSSDGRHLVYADGRRFFSIGCNYTGALDTHGRFWEPEHFDPRLLEVHFRRSRDAGINVWRFCGWCGSAPLEADILAGDFSRIDIYLEFALRYGVYQLLTPPGSYHLDLSRRLRTYTALARHVRGHPAVLGYDLLNEPGVERLTGVAFPEGTRCPTQEFDFLGAYPGQLGSRSEELRQQARDRRVWRHALSPGISEEQAFNVACAAYLYGRWRREYGISFSTFPEIDQAWPPSDAWRQAIDAINGGLATWVNVQAEALRRADPTHMVTVGYNQLLSCFPGNSGLDFVSQHVYQRPYTFEDVQKNITTLDRLRHFWPDKPITFGEFGYSSGVEMPNGEFLGVQAASVGEMVHWLYALANGYDGCKKWVLNDHPLPYMHHFGNWAGRGIGTQTYEARFGLYAYDGSLMGRPKPIAHALHFLRTYVDRAGPVGDVDITRGRGLTAAHYVFRGEKALFIGSDQHDSPELSFAVDGAANVMLDWGDGTLRVMATADMHVSVLLEAFVDGLSNQRLRLSGKNGGIRHDGKRIRIRLLAGRAVCFRHPKR